MVERLKHIKETLMSAVESQMYNLSEVDTEELGDVIDMLKDLEEATYYCSVVKAMEESEKYKEKNGSDMMYYPPMYYDERSISHENSNGMHRSYYSNGNGSSSSSNGNSSNGSSSYYSSGNNGNGSSSGSNGSSSSQYTEREFPYAFQDVREGKSHRSRRMYMEAKETHQDKSVQMKELEKYVQELAQDMVEMVEGASPEEKQYLSKKISALATKLTQLND